MRIEVKIGGSGGQGVVLAGQVLGRAAVYDGKNAVQTQSYGAEARGSAARSEVIISDRRIGFPETRKCDVIIAMNQAALESFLGDLKKEGILLIDSTQVKKVPQTKSKVYSVPATENAEKIFKSKMYANMIMLGALTEITDIASEIAMEKAIEDTVPKKMAALNKQAFKKGHALK